MKESSHSIILIVLRPLLWAAAAENVMSNEKELIEDDLEMSSKCFVEKIILYQRYALICLSLQNTF